MSWQHDGGPAFPLPDEGPNAGMSLRDFFASQALMALIAEPHWPGIKMSLTYRLTRPCRPSIENTYAEAAYKLADAMLAERCAEKEDAAG